MALSDVNKDGKIDEEEFTKFAQGKQYQGGMKDWKKLSHVKILPFRYKHLGGFEYVGYDHEITERKSASASILDGFGAFWLWRSIFVSNILSARTRLHMSLNWFLSKVFGRNLLKDE